MDFLGLRTLSILKDTIALIAQKRNEVIDLERLPLDDVLTYQLYQRGDTIATFQFESEGMREWLKKLVPNQFEDLIAMNSLYRPGPMQFIPNFIARKHGKEKIVYPHPLLENILKNTYGIIVYQEQVMQTAQLIAGYTLGEADILRKAMGKKQVEEMLKQRNKFVEGAKKEHQLTDEKAVEIFEMMEKFAQYGFVRAHATAYAIVAYQTAYLKTHYPAEYMSAVLIHHQGDIGKLGFFMKECKKQGVEILGPDVNESYLNFDVNKNQQIRFGLAAIKGVGEAAAQNIIDTRAQYGKFSDIYDFLEKVNAKATNKKNLEALAISGSFDSLADYHRKQYVFSEKGNPSLLEKALQHVHKLRNVKQTTQQSLFGKDSTIHQPTKPEVSGCEPYSIIEQLQLEKDYVGFYFSGHPLDPFQVELRHFCNACSQTVLACKQREVSIGGIIIDCNHRVDKQGNPFVSFTLEDYEGVLPLALFREEYLKNKHMIQLGMLVHITGIVTARYQRADTWVFRPQKIHLLSDIRRKFSRNLHLTLPIERIKDSFVVDLKALITQHEGACKLQLAIKDERENIEVTLQTTKQDIYPSNEFLYRLEALTGTKQEGYKFIS